MRMLDNIRLVLNDRTRSGQRVSTKPAVQQKQSHGGDHHDHANGSVRDHGDHPEQRGCAHYGHGRGRVRGRNHDHGHYGCGHGHDYAANIPSIST